MCPNRMAVKYCRAAPVLTIWRASTIVPRRVGYFGAGVVVADDEEDDVGIAVDCCAVVVASVSSRPGYCE